MKRSGKLWIPGLCLLFLAAAVLIICFWPRETEAEQTGKPGTVVIDPGHGGQDGGALGADGTPEKELNLQFALLLRKKLESQGVTVIMTRDSDTDTDGVDAFKKKQDLIRRAQIANESGADLFVSIHMNSSTSTSDRGFQVFYGSASNKSAKLAETIRDYIQNANICFRIREVKAAPSALYLFRTVTLPTALVECGFLSNADDRELLKQEAFQEAFSQALCDAILQYLSDSSTC